MTLRSPQLTRSRLRSLWVFGAGVAALELISASAFAAECEESYEFMSGDYILAKADCGVNAALDSGAQALTNMAKDVTANLVNQYLPGLGSLLFGGNKPDPFAGHANRIVNRIGTAERNIIDAIFEEHRRYNLVQISAIIEGLEDRANETFTEHLGDELWYRQKWDDLALARIDCQTPIQGDVPTERDLPALHTAILVAGLQFDLAPTLALIEKVGSFPEESEPQQARLAEAEAHDDIYHLLEGSSGLMHALRDIDAHDVFWQASAGHFSPPVRCYPQDHRPYTCVKWSVEGVGTYKATLEQRSQRPPSVWGAIYRPDGSLLDEVDLLGEASTFQAFEDYALASYEELRHSAYENFLLDSYGPIRPIIDSWYREIGVMPPSLTIDEELDAIATRGTALEGWHRFGLPALEDLAPSAWTAFDSRQYIDTVLSEGIPYVLIAEIDAGARDPLAGEPPTYPISTVRRLFYGDLDTYAYFKGQFAAKLVSL